MGDDFINGFGHVTAGYGNGKEKSLGRRIFAGQEYSKAAAFGEWGGGNGESAYACKEAVSSYGMCPEMESA